MALLATFIGINKHVDPRISDLSGAKNDALALWALFTDSIPDMQSSLLLDEQATQEAIIQSFNKTLGSATNEDTVIAFFAGHGTPDHQLVPYNADCGNLDSTTIPMYEISRHLASSHASSIVFILDCCFSGGATARVLSDIPKPRGKMTTVEVLQGKGRVIIAASRDDQPAYEHKGHGLLTKALIQVLIDNKEGVEIGHVTDYVLANVRTEAARFNWNQTPVVFNLIEGGLKFPPIQPGENYYQVFPDFTNVTISKDLIDLSKFGVPSKIIDLWKSQFSDGLNPLQIEAVNTYRILDGDSLLVVAPTSSGKTFIGEMASVKAIADGNKVVFLMPYRALTNEKYEDFQTLYGDRLGIRVIRCTGDYTDDTKNFILGRYEIALLTFEMFLRLSVVAPSLLSRIGLIVLDEAHFIGDPTRGINVELLLTNLISYRKQGIEPQIIALSAVIGDVNHFHEWLECKILCSYDRPVPLIEGVLDRSGLFQYIDKDVQEATRQLLPRTSIFPHGKESSRQDMIIPLVKLLVSEDNQIIIFRNTRGATVGCASYLANELDFPPANSVLNNISDQDPSRTTTKLKAVLTKGIAFHNSDLTRDERRAVELGFRDKSGQIRVLVATTTVSAGVNTPSSAVIISETWFPDEEKRAFTIAQYKNMAGRAGRLGYKEQGVSILLTDTPMERNRLFNHYVKGKPEPICSSFDPSDIETWILRLLSQVDEIPKDNVVNLLANTYGGYLEGQKNPNWNIQMQHTLTSLLQHMIQLELLEEMNGNVRLSLLGRMCGRSSLTFKSMITLLNLLKQIHISLSAEQLMALLHVLPEVGDYTPINKRSHKDSQWQGDVSSLYGNEIARILQHRVSDQNEYYARCKRAAILWYWINGEPIDAIEKRFSTHFGGTIEAGNIRGFADRTRMHLGSIGDIVKLLLLDKSPKEDSMDTLLKRLEIGLPSDALDLLNLPVQLTRGEYLAFYQAGFKKADVVLSLPRETVCRYISVEKYEQLVRHS